MKISYLLIFLSVFFSCQNDDDFCSNQYVAFKQIEEISDCQNTLWNFTLNTDESDIIVRNQQDFEQYVNTGDCAVQVDFNQYDLIIGTQYVAEATKFEYTVVDVCEENQLYLHVRILNANLNDFEKKAIFHVLVPKLNNGQSVQITFGVG
ncbi:MAG TPA: hypothetical protein VL022_07695 [Moheibacter sp.]|nr:hypothetical protein [Moheibacter sp.]